MNHNDGSVKYFTAVICPATGGTRFVKYHNVKNTLVHLQRLRNHVNREFSAWAHHINYYAAKTEKNAGQFVFQEKLISSGS